MEAISASAMPSGTSFQLVRLDTSNRDSLFDGLFSLGLVEGRSSAPCLSLSAPALLPCLDVRLFCVEDHDLTLGRSLDGAEEGPLGDLGPMMRADNMFNAFIVLPNP